jgi:hypothetical protein
MRSLILILGFSLITGICQADTLQLMDGRTLTGKIVQEEGDRIVFEDDGGRMSNFYKDQVKDIIRGDSVPLNIDPKQFPDIETDKVGNIQRLLEANGTKASLERNIRRAIDEAPESSRETLSKLFNINELTAALVPIYDRYYTEAEVLELITFYESPAGTKMLTVAPELIQEVTEASLNYFKESYNKNK